MTLRELMEKHPELADLPIVVEHNGTYHYIDGSGMFYEAEDWPDVPEGEEVVEGEGVPVLVMAPN